MTPGSNDVAELDDQAVLRVLSHLTLELRESIDPVSLGAVQSEAEATEALRQLITKAGFATPPTVPSGTDPGIGTARQCLAMLLTDPETRPQASTLMRDPPDDEQRSVEVATTAAIVLGAVITWLQTKLVIDVRRKNGQTEFLFRLRKEGASEALLRETAKKVSDLLRR